LLFSEHDESVVRLIHVIWQQYWRQQTLKATVTFIWNIMSCC